MAEATLCHTDATDHDHDADAGLDAVRPRPARAPGHRARSGRAAALTAAMAALCFTLLAVPALGAGLPILAAGREAGVDYGSLVVAARLARSDPASLYDPAAQVAVQRTLLADGPARPFTNPPPVATAARLVTARGVRNGFLIMQAVSLVALAGLAALAWRLARREHLVVRLVAATGTVATASVATVLAEGAVSAVAGLGLGLVLYGERRRSAWTTAVGLVLAATKPHLALGALAVLVLRRDRAALWRAALLGAVAILPSLVTPGPTAWVHYPVALLQAGGDGAAALMKVEHWWTVGSLLHQGLGPSQRSLAVALTWLCFVAGTAAALAWAARRRGHGAEVVAVVLLTGLVLAPHANPHDALWVPLALVVLRTAPGWAGRRPANRAVLTAVALTWPPLTLLAITYAAAGGSALVVVAVATMVLAGGVGVHSQPVHPAGSDTVPADEPAEPAEPAEPDHRMPTPEPTAIV